MEINEQDYNINYDADTATLHFEGTLRLIGVHAYESIATLLDKVADIEPPLITINLRQLNSLNSSGVTTLAKFVIKVSKKEHIQMVIQGSTKIAWQKKSLTNLKRLMPRLQLEWE
jgi:hypothetical protein